MFFLEHYSSQMHVERIVTEGLSLSSVFYISNILFENNVDEMLKVCYKESTSLLLKGKTGCTFVLINFIL